MGYKVRQPLDFARGDLRASDRGQIEVNMKAFFIGLIFLISAVLLAGLGVLLFPLLLVLGIFLRIAVYFILVIFAVWLLGKLIIMAWEAIRGRGGPMSAA